MALAVPLSRFTPRVGGGSAFFVRPHYTHIIMKRIFILLLASLLVTFYSSSADDTNAVTNVIDFESATPSQVLTLYEKMSGLDFVIDSRVKKVSSPIKLRIAGSLTKDEVLKQMREAFLKQAGIVITRLDDKQESVTYNDALPISQ